MYNLRRRESVEPVYKAMGILKFIDINKYLIARFMYRYCNDLVPELFQTYFISNYEYHDYTTRQAHHFHIPKVKTDLAKTGIKYRGAIVWNFILHKSIYPDTSEAIFVKFLKKIVDIIP